MAIITANAFRSCCAKYRNPGNTTTQRELFFLIFRPTFYRGFGPPVEEFEVWLDGLGSPCRPDMKRKERDMKRKEALNMKRKEEYRRFAASWAWQKLFVSSAMRGALRLA